MILQGIFEKASSSAASKANAALRRCPLIIWNEPSSILRTSGMSVRPSFLMDSARLFMPSSSME